jgi:hypothetical protein
LNAENWLKPLRGAGNNFWQVAEQNLDDVKSQNRTWMKEKFVASQSIQSKKGGEDPDLLLSWGSPETPCEHFRILEIFPNSAVIILGFSFNPRNNVVSDT